MQVKRLMNELVVSEEGTKLNLSAYILICNVSINVPGNNGNNWQ